MKDIKQYFANGAKLVEEEQVASDSGSVEELQRDQLEEGKIKGKRKRVKIRISRAKDSKERMCDIIESRNDMIDKTPSPFNAKVNSSDGSLQDGTPKSRLIGLNGEQNVKKVCE